MLAKIRAAATYANVIATLALFLALGGGAYAALKLPKASVGTKQLKTGAVVSSKVGDHSLLAKDFKPGQLPAGAIGPQGPQGTQGVQGEQGVPGTPGTPATSLFAYVSHDGIAVYGKGVVAANVDSNSLFTVTFDRNLDHCVPTGNVGVGNPGAAPGHFIQTFPDAVLTASLDASHPNQVNVAIRSSNTNRQSAFFLVVFC
jgi:hypothetical protein